MKRDAFCDCHPAVAMLYFCLVIGSTMFVNHPIILFFSFLGAFSYAAVLKGIRHVLKLNLLFTLPGLLITALLNPLFNHYGVTTLAYLNTSGNCITLEAVVYGLVLGSVLFIVILWFSCYNTVMTSDKFIYLFGRLIPALSLILSMALRFVPRFFRQTEMIRNGMKCSGRDISNAGLVNKARYGLAMLSILITWALENAIDTADSMKSRGYGLKGRSAFSRYRFDRRDRLIFFFLSCLFAIFLYAVSNGAAYALYNPRIILAGFSIAGYEADITCESFMVYLGYLSFLLLSLFPAAFHLIERFLMSCAIRAGSGDLRMTYRGIYESYTED